jgi:hypothetical protein
MTYTVALVVIYIEKHGQFQNGRKSGGETLLPLLVGI